MSNSETPTPLPACPTQPRFYIDHDMVHDRVTGKHITTDEDSVFCDGRAACCVLLNELSDQANFGMRAKMAAERIGSWLSAALDDSNICAEMKADINAWMEVVHETPAAWSRRVTPDAGVREALEREVRAEHETAKRKSNGEEYTYWAGVRDAYDTVLRTIIPTALASSPPQVTP